MTYAQIVQGIAKLCGDEAAIDYDKKFRQWRQVAPQACPWNLRNMELFHTSKSLNIYTDVSNSEYEGVFGHQWFYGPFDDGWLNFHIYVI